MHAVTHPREPFTTGDGRLEIHQVPAASDNLVWIAVCRATREAAIVDGPDAEGALAHCAKHGLKLTTILNTHTHGDHVGVNHDLAKRGMLAGLRVFGPARKAADVPGLTDPIDEGSTVRVGQVEGRVLLTEGHIDGHVSIVFDDVVFCGDTMFGAGCGYLFDGPPAKMHASLSRLGALSPATRICCAHEYTQDNLRFAWSIEPDNQALRDRIRATWALRAEGRCSVPSTLEEELATNPFLRFRSPTLRENVARAMGRSLEGDADVFAATRALKDRKDYKSIADAALPIG